MKKIFKLFVVVTILFSVWFWHARWSVDAGDQKTVLVTIETGDSVSAIALKLQSLGLIRSPFAFKLSAKISGTASGLQAGSFVLRPSMSVGEILEILHSGKSETMRVTIPEGFTVADIDALLASKGLGQPGDVIHCAFTCDFSTFEFLPTTSFGPEANGYGSRLEGYLFPETYDVNTAQYKAKFFLERQLGEFRKRVIEAKADDIKSSGHTLSEIVTMASLIEDESRHNDERAIVSGILWKRLASHTVLGVDSVNRYALGKKTEALTRADLEADSPYNSRRRQGLPPTPIDNPGESSIGAALHPKASDYWYYLHDAGGVIHYAKTIDEHAVNKARFLR